MMSVTDFYALIGIDLVACAVLLRATSVLVPALATPKAPAWVMWLSAIFLIVLWLPFGDAGLPLLAFARGILSDLSVTSVLLALLYLAQHLGFSLDHDYDHEKRVVHIALTCAALVLYPTALGWGDWDAYRLGWGGATLVMGLSLLTLFCFSAGLRLLPMLVAGALMAWSFGLLESGNLWDYLMDPWITCVSIGAVLKAGWGVFRRPVL